MTTLRYRDDERLTPEQRSALSGPGAMFERTTEVVLGAEVEVFVQRPRSLVEVLRTSAETFGDRPYLVFPDLGGGGETVTFAEVPAIRRSSPPRSVGLLDGECDGPCGIYRQQVAHRALVVLAVV